MIDSYIKIFSKGQSENSSQFSKKSDHVIPKQFHNFKDKILVLRQGMFYVKNQIYIYQINGAKSWQKNVESLCWSVYLKKHSRYSPIWQYHKFSRELLFEIFPKGNYQKNNDDDPIELLADFIQNIAKYIAGMMVE